jgi:hypothetical protein
MQRYGQLDYAQSRTKVAAGLCDCVDGFGAQFVGELLELFSRQILEIAREPNTVEQGGFGNLGQK